MLHSNQIGGWSTEGLTVDKIRSNRTSVACFTRHLTSFAVLVSIQDERPVRTIGVINAFQMFNVHNLAISSWWSIVNNFIHWMFYITSMSLYFHYILELYNPPVSLKKLLTLKVTPLLCIRIKDNKNHLFVHLNLCIALALCLVVFITGIENATNNEVTMNK